MRRTMFVIPFLFAAVALAADDPVDLWAKAVGGRDKVAAVKATYREATVEIAGLTGWIHAWHTTDGKYRKEEQVGPYSSVETFDGTTAVLKQGPAPARTLAGPELARARSSPFANWNAVFFAFFPERRHGTLAMEEDGTLVMKPEGGIDWRVTLDPATCLPKTMVHKEGERTITVQFVSYDSIDGLRFEKEIHRTMGDPHYDAVIKFTKTVINPSVDAAMFTQ